jgi:hypothetical protein
MYISLQISKLELCMNQDFTSHGKGDTANKSFSVNLKSWNGQVGSACKTSNTKECFLKFY